MTQKTADLMKLSRRLLIACDQSYAGSNLVVDVDFLRRYDDPLLKDDYKPPHEAGRER